MAHCLEHLKCEHWNALLFLMARSNTISKHWIEATTDGFWQATKCSKNSIFNTKTSFGNWSSYYAMAVIELAEAVAREMPNKR
jgi:hypothetical protein